MNMFDSLLNSIPKNRLDYVNDLEIPEYKLSPYIWTELDDSLSAISESILSGGPEECERGTLHTASSIPLSRAMTDSDIDYDRYKRYRRLNYSDPWDHMRYAMDRFPADYVAKLNRYMPTETAAELAAKAVERPYGYITYNEDVRRRMRKYFDEECTFFARDDPGLLELKAAVRNLDLKAIDLEACDLDHMRGLDYLNYRYYPYDYWWRSPTYSRYRRRYYPRYLNRYYRYNYTYPRYYNYL